MTAGTRALPDAPRVLLTGASGFVGRHAKVAFEAAGYDVRCGTRDPERARRLVGAGHWVAMDVEDSESLEAALDGCDLALFLVHQMKAGSNYPEHERRSAERFREAADAAGVRRIVYLGGVEPGGRPSRHLASRLRTGEVLRAGRVEALELRAAMVVGHGSESWRMVRDLAARLPAMILPRWLRNHSWPVAIEDVVIALLAASDAPIPAGGFYDVPGPERFTHRRVLEIASGLIRGRPPVSLHVPVLSPRLSSYWIALVTSVDLEMARELVEGLRYDLDPTGPLIWETLPGSTPVPVEQAIQRALADDRAGQLLSDETRSRLCELGTQYAQRNPG